MLALLWSTETVSLFQHFWRPCEFEQWRWSWKHFFLFWFIIWKQIAIEVFHPNHACISSLLCKVHSLPFRRQPWLTRKHQHRLDLSNLVTDVITQLFSSRKHFAKKSQQFNSAFCMRAVGASEWDGGARNETIFVATFGRNWKCCFEIQPDDYNVWSCCCDYWFCHRVLHRGEADSMHLIFLLRRYRGAASRLQPFFVCTCWDRIHRAAWLNRDHKVLGVNFRSLGKMCFDSCDITWFVLRGMASMNRLSTSNLVRK